MAVDLQLLLQRHGYKLARAAAGDDTRRAVFDQKVDQLVKRGIINMFVLPAEGSHKREYNAAHFLFSIVALLYGVFWNKYSNFKEQHTGIKNRMQYAE